MNEKLDTVMAGARRDKVAGWFDHGASRIYYEDYGSGDPVLLLPGFAGNIDELSALTAVLVSSGHRVIAADLPGSGRSQPQPRTYPATYFSDDAASFTALLQHLAPGPSHLMGFSDGGEVSLLMAAKTPGLARSVATWGAAGSASDPDGELRAAMYNVIDDPIPPLKGFRDYLISVYGEADARATTRSLVEALTKIIEAGGDISLAIAEKITCPVLLITGEHDMFVPSMVVSRLAARIPNVETRVVAGAGHDVHHSHLEWLNQAILDWLARQDRSHS